MQGDLWIGVESGFYQEDGRWIVIISIIFLDKEENEWSVWSQPLVCPITKKQRSDNIKEATLDWKRKHWL